MLNEGSGGLRGWNSVASRALAAVQLRPMHVRRTWPSQTLTAGWR